MSPGRSHPSRTYPILLGLLPFLLGALAPAIATDEEPALDFSAGRGQYIGDLSDAAWAASIPAHLLADASQTGHFIVQFDGPVHPEWRGTLAHVANGRLEYLPHFSYLAELSPEARHELRQRAEVRAIEPYHPALKLSPRLVAEGVIDVTALAYREAEASAVASQAADLGAEVLSWTTTSLDHVLRLRIDAERVPELARVEDISWIEPWAGPGSLDNALATSIAQSGVPDAWTLHAAGIDGSTQVANLCDTGVNTELYPSVESELSQPVFSMTHETHDDEQGLGLIEYNAYWSAAPLPLSPHRKILSYYSPHENGNRGDWDDDHGHGTQMAATLAGDAPPYGIRNDNDGMAPAARLVVCDAFVPLQFQILDDYANYWNPAYDLGARVSSNSWGTDPTGDYTVTARQQDAFVRDHEGFVLVRSMGNAGPDGLPRPEAMSKNVVAVGATLNDGFADSTAPTSSSGPAADGRIKPDVVAPGTCLLTADLPGATSEICSSGTSPATALVSGAAVLVRDYFAKGFYPTGRPSPDDAFEPSSALVRGLLAASGVEIGGDRSESGFPNRVQGWGRVLLDDVLFLSGDGPRLAIWDEDAALETGDRVVLSLDVVGGQPLQILLAWTDAAGAPGAGAALVNDLDLVVEGPRGVRLAGNDFSDAPGRRPAAADRRNVLEAVQLDPAPAGPYSIEIRGHNVPAGPQTFALIAVGGIE